MSELLEKKCIPCSVETDPLKEDEINEYIKELEKGHHPIIILSYGRVKVRLYTHL